MDKTKKITNAKFNKEMRIRDGDSFIMIKVEKDKIVHTAMRGEGGVLIAAFAESLIRNPQLAVILAGAFRIIDGNLSADDKERFEQAFKAS